jgi:adenine-specific DNA methylase
MSKGGTIGCRRGKDYDAAWKARKRIDKITSIPITDGLNLVPDEPTPVGGGSGAGRAFSIQKYGMMTFGDLYTARQKLALVTITKLLKENGCDPELEKATKSLLLASISRLADKNASLAVWNQIGEKIEHVFSRQALPIVWDFAEVAIFSNATGNYESGVNLVREVAENWARANPLLGQAQQADACSVPLPGCTALVLFTDPPYYDAIPYSDLSDFFFVWFKRVLPGHPLLRDPFYSENPLTPKIQEIVQDEIKQADGRPKDRIFFEEMMAKAFAEGRRILKENGVGCVVFAHKTTEGWEALLSGLIRGGWTITGS